MEPAGAGQTASVFVDLVGWIFFAVSFLLAFTVAEFTRNRRLGVAFITAMLVRQMVTVHRAYMTLPYSDAGDLHREALGQGDAVGMTLGVGAHAYVGFLSTAYDLLGRSWFLGQQLSNFAFALACVAVVKILRELDVKGYAHVLLLLFALPLSVLRFTSDTFRESYQIMFFAGALLWAVRFKQTGNLWQFLLFAALALAMGFFHDGLIVYSALLIGMVILWPSPRSYGKPRWRVTTRGVRLALILTAVVVMGVMAGSRLVSSGIGGAPALYALTSSRVLEYAASYRREGMLIDARTTYGGELNTSSPAAFAASVAVAFTQYMAGPFPWEVRGAADAYGMAEALLRVLLLYFAIRTVWRWPPAERRIGVMLLACYFTLAGIWSVGTVNYGTAIRHHLTTTWIVLVLGGPALLDKVRRILTAGMQPSPRLPASA